MGANKEKQNIRYKAVSRRTEKKVRFDGFTPEEIKNIKLQKNYERFEKEINNFWATAPRCDNGSVAWERLSEDELNLFEYINKQKEKYNKQIVKYEEQGIVIDKIMNMFMKLNVQSVSY
ncbi:hypothetical protein HFE03_07395 [Paenibacillus sp. EKM102P]|uniref:hypothetical protein n=1 Tax=unclassified Paenibacillus TaxID=185978 RepID=UPI00142E2D49|nr:MULTISPECIES: hypothetical protein [unclassified Paenibacillus]KAF6620471.1 hypothetical protein HFE00_05300 [Paenibacillus sp. EKM101P]KAF6623463.1 hypothetical protein HFE03_07395 [Paenibacillus sp. EKM102P]KAF6633975.1 hypothetical protein HFE01_07115 [Paenibacillus sp. EKM10P]KAF6649501.1 hypothetical protein HFE02_02075 [Paenibacillus sp. EKM11P]